MIRLFLLLTITTTVGCTAPRYGVEAGYVRPAFTTGSSTRKVEAFHGAVRAEWEVLDWLDLGIGPSWTQPLSKEGKGIGLEGVARARWTKWDAVQPYLVGTAAAEVYEHRWGTQSTKWGFVLGLGVGVRLLGVLYVDYRFFHESNGSKVFGTSGSNPGFEGLGVFAGYSKEF